MRQISPTGSYAMDVPVDIQLDCDQEIVSLWRKGSNVLLQLSSRERHSGPQVDAATRVHERVASDGLVGTVPVTGLVARAPDGAGVRFTDPEGVTWIYYYAVWPSLSVFITLSWQDDELSRDGQWALEALGQLRDVGGHNTWMSGDTTLN